MTLNVPYVVTFFIDYALMASLVLFTYAASAASAASGSSSASPESAAFAAGLCGLFTLFINTSREYLYMRFLAPHFAAVKTEHSAESLLRKFVADIAQTGALFSVIPALCAYYGFMHAHFDDKNWVKTLVGVSADYYLINMIKDNTSMRFLHPWMHKRENYYLHKHHHVGNKNMTQIHAYAIGIMDFNIEFGVGSVLALLVKYVLFGGVPSLHLLSFMFSGWTDSNIHSLNPYTQAIGNPFLDYVLKLNIVHNLHHAYEKDAKYMTVWPVHHLTPAGRSADVDRYNKLMNTNVDFRVFI